jgi:hypothetical protein
LAEEGEGKKEEEAAPENGDVFNAETGEYIGSIEPFAELSWAMDHRIMILHDGFMYIFKLEGREKHNVEG